MKYFYTFRMSRGNSSGFSTQLSLIIRFKHLFFGAFLPIFFLQNTPAPGIPAPVATNISTNNVIARVVSDFNDLDYGTLGSHKIVVSVANLSCRQPSSLAEGLRDELTKLNVNTCLSPNPVWFREV